MAVNTTEDIFKEHRLELTILEQYMNQAITELLKQSYSDSEMYPIEHISSRIKTNESTKLKLEKLGMEPTEQNAFTYLHDIIGIRLVLHFVGDIYKIKTLIEEAGLFEIIEEKDYIKNPKKKGYRGFHIIVQTNLNNINIQAEIQLRTVAMDCWASLEHQIRYKKNEINQEIIDEELKKCSDSLMAADITMEQIRKFVCT